MPVTRAPLSQIDAAGIPHVDLCEPDDELALAVIGFDALPGMVAAQITAGGRDAIAALQRGIALRMMQGTPLPPGLLEAAAAAVNVRDTWWPATRRPYGAHPYSLLVPARWGLDAVRFAIYVRLREQPASAETAAMRAACEASAALSTAWAAEIGPPYAGNRPRPSVPTLRAARREYVRRMARVPKALLVIAMVPPGRPAPGAGPIFYRAPAAPANDWTATCPAS